MKPRSASPRPHASPSLTDNELSPRQRPSERALDYLRAQIARARLPDGSRLPTVRDLARRLDVSPSAVQAAFRQLREEGAIRTRVGSGAFAVGRATAAPLRVALNMPLPMDNSPRQWGTQVVGAILQAAGRAPRRLDIRPLSANPSAGANPIDFLLREVRDVDALILLPSRDCLPVAEAYERAGKGVVHVNPPSASATVNFVSADFHGASLRAGRALRESGRRRPAMVLASSLATSVSEGLRMAGFLVGADPEGREEDLPRLIRARGVGEEDGYAAMREHLARRRPPPDAVLCTGDFLALGALRALTERGLRVPAQVSVIGGDGLDLGAGTGDSLTCLRQPIAEIGRAIVAMLCQRADRGGAPVPGRFLPTSFALGRTTRPAENARLQ